MNNCICLICLKPNEIWLDFLDKFIKYNIYIIIDDNKIDYKKLYKKYKNLHIIQITSKICVKNGFIKMNFIIKKLVTAWEKAMYYFSNINLEYDNIWFLEDDVFLNEEQTLINIDNKYLNSDLLTNKYYENINGNKDNWHWKRIQINFLPPYYCSMVCACRISKNLLLLINEYAQKYKTLFFLEALFPTIAKKNNLIYDTPEELQNISYRNTFDLDNINLNFLYHPIKNLDIQYNIREKTYIINI